MLSHPTLGKNTYSFCMSQNHVGFPLEVYVPRERSCRFCRAQRPPLAMHTRSLLLSWDSPFTTDFLFIVLGTSAKKLPSCAVSGNLLPAKELFLALFRGTWVLVLHIYRRCQHHPATQYPSHSAPFISCLRKAFPFTWCFPSSAWNHSWCLCCDSLQGIVVMLVTGDTSLGAGFGLLNTLGEYWLKTSLLLLSTIQRIFMYFHLVFQYCSGHTRGKASFHHPQAKI